MIRDTNTENPIVDKFKPCYYNRQRTLDYFHANAFGQPQPFPIDAISPALYASYEEAYFKYKTAPELIFASQIATVSAVVQSSYNVMRHNGIETPVSVFLISIADSGLRKTSVDRHFTAVLDNIDSICELKALTVDSPQYEPVKKTAKRPRRKIKYSDTTPEALLHGLNDWPTAALFSNEAGTLLNSRTAGNLASFNQIWDGQQLEVDRVGSDSFVLQDARLSLSLMIQPETFRQFLKKRGKLSRDNGFLPRCLHADVDANLYVGMRFENYNQPNEWVTAPEHDIFKKRIIDIIDKSLTGEAKLIKRKKIISFDEKARIACINFHNDVEGAMQTGQPLSDIRDAAGKAIDNMARLAALFHVYEDEQGDIRESTVNRAVDIMRWYINSYKCLYGQRMIQQSYISDAQILRDWIFNWLCKNPNNCCVTRRFIRQHCPNVLRQERRIDFALDELAMHHQVWFKMQGKATHVTFNMSYFQPHLQQQASYFAPSHPALMHAVGI